MRRSRGIARLMEGLAVGDPYAVLVLIVLVAAALAALVSLVKARKASRRPTSTESSQADPLL